MRVLIKNLFMCCLLTTVSLSMEAYSQAEYRHKNEHMHDENAQRYRIYYDAVHESAFKNKLVVKNFNGQIRLENIRTIFGDVANLPVDAYGNRVGGWRYYQDKVWAVTIGPLMSAVNLVSIGNDGVISSAYDLDGDGVVDIVDTRLADDRRHTVVTEALGMEVFQLWLAGLDPLCKETRVSGVQLPAFGCPQDGGHSGGVAAGKGAQLYDPWDLLCGEYGGRGNGGLRPSVMAQLDSDGLPQRVRLRSSSRNAGQYGDITYDRTQDVYYDENGDHAITVTVTTYKDSTTGASREVYEQVDSEGNGYREVTDTQPDGSRSSSNKHFQTQVDENGEYDDGGHPRYDEDAPGGGPGARETNTSPPPNPTNPGGHPGDDPNLGMAEWCANQAPIVSGVEQAAAFNPATFSVSCDDIVKQYYAAAAGSQCTVVEWAKRDDLLNMGVPSASSNCGPYEQPGPDGSCGVASGVQRLLGNTSWIGSANLEAVEICDPSVCMPAP